MAIVEFRNFVLHIGRQRVSYLIKCQVMKFFLKHINSAETEMKVVEVNFRWNVEVSILKISTYITKCYTYKSAKYLLNISSFLKCKTLANNFLLSDCFSPT